MTPIEKAENALNGRIERLQANLRQAESEVARQFLFQSLVVCIGIGEALTDYVRAIGQYAKERHGALKESHDALTVRHDALLQSGNALLAQWKANPTDQALRKQIEQAQRDMEAIQKTLRRGANSLQREIAPSMAMLDKLAVSVARFGEADQLDALKRGLKLVLENVRELYHAQLPAPARGIVEVAAWEESAVTEIDQAADFYAAYASTGYVTMQAIDAMSVAVSPVPPETAEAAAQRANEMAAGRLKSVAARFVSAPE